MHERTQSTSVIVKEILSFIKIINLGNWFTAHTLSPIIIHGLIFARAHWTKHITWYKLGRWVQAIVNQHVSITSCPTHPASIHVIVTVSAPEWIP